MGNVQHDELADELGAGHGQVPGDEAAPVVPDERARRTEPVDELGDVIDDARQSIFGDVARFRRIVEAAQIGSYRAKSGTRERRHLPAPRVPEFGEAVEENDERA